MTGKASSPPRVPLSEEGKATGSTTERLSSQLVVPSEATALRSDIPKVVRDQEVENAAIRSALEAAQQEITARRFQFKHFCAVGIAHPFIGHNLEECPLCRERSALEAARAEIATLTEDNRLNIIAFERMRDRREEAEARADALKAALTETVADWKAEANNARQGENVWRLRKCADKVAALLAVEQGESK